MTEIAEGATFPDVEVTHMTEQGPAKASTHSLFKGKKVVLFAIPGAFTPTCTSTHCPSFTRDAEKLKQKGVDLVACTAVNDVFVMDAFADYQKAKGKILFLADGSAVLAGALGMTLDLTTNGLGVRSKRYAMIIDDLVVKYVGVDTKGVEKSGAEAVLAKL